MNKIYLVMMLSFIGCSTKQYVVHDRTDVQAYRTIYVMPNGEKQEGVIIKEGNKTKFVTLLKLGTFKGYEYIQIPITDKNKKQFIHAN